MRHRPIASARARRAPWLHALCMGLMLVASAAAGDKRALTADEWQVKSAFLYNFTKFVEWPPSSLADPQAPIVIGVLGDPARLAELRAVVLQRKVNGRAILVRTVQTVAEARRTQLLFVSAEEEKRFAAMRDAIADWPVLTVGESPAFSAGAGVIGFVQAGDKLRFEINIAVAERARLRISAQLQKLAAAVHRSAERGPNS